jgi:plasmid stabilization system protein ParE
VGKAINLSDGAKLDYNESFDWYGERSPAAALGFSAAVEEAFERIAAAPHRFSATDRGCRYCALKRYPFQIIFRERTRCIEIVAIAHAKRRPGYWRDRVKESDEPSVGNGNGDQ